MGASGKRILMLLENNPYKRDSRVKNEACSLVDAGYQVTVIAPKLAGDKMREVVDNGVCLYQFPEPAGGTGLIGLCLGNMGMRPRSCSCCLYLYGCERDLTSFMRIIHQIQCFLLPLSLNPLAKSFVYDHHDLSPEVYKIRYEDGGNPKVYNMLLWLEKMTCRLADHVITTNASHKRIEMERGGVAESDITIVRNGPDTSVLRLTEPDPELRQKAGTILGYVGIMGPQDGIDYLLRALHKLVYEFGTKGCVLHF